MNSHLVWLPGIGPIILELKLDSRNIKPLAATGIGIINSEPNPRELEYD
jgi:hypothetical protein